jgi:hypothetical protein
MTAFQWIFIVFSAVQAVRHLVRLRRPRASRLLESAFLAAWVGAIIVLINQEATMELARWLGIHRGADVFVYSFCFVSLWAHYQMYVRYKHVETCNTLLVRELAIDSAAVPDTAATRSGNPKHAGVWIVIPAFNEGKRLPLVLEGLLPGYRNITVVDDGSRDDTSEAARRYPVHVLRHRINRGQGAALQTGITYSLLQGAEAIVTFDADNQHQPADLPRMLAPVLRGECDVMLGSRFLGDSSNVPPGRRLLLRAARLVTWATSGLLLSDAHNGLRVLSRKAAEAIHLHQDRMAHASEIYDQISRARLTYREMPVTIRYTAETLAKGQSAGNAVNVLFHYLFGKLQK